jgi:spermidine synthase
MNRNVWLTDNRSAIAERLRWLHDKSDGVLCVEASGQQFVIVTKAGPRLRLITVEQARPRTTITQSHLDLNDPFYLVSPYTQAAMLGLLWKSEPRKIFVAGLGGGRVPLLFHHYLPRAVIQCAEIDPVVLSTATKYFGVRADNRLLIAVQDAREWLAGCHPRVQYDIIFVDAFLGNGYTPFSLATTEFYSLCKIHLEPNGVLIVNLLQTTPFYRERIKTIHSVFPQIYPCPVPGKNTVVFASQAPPLSKEELLERVDSIQNHHHFSFPFAERAKEMGVQLSDHLPDLNRVQILRDGAPPDGYFDDLPS